MASAAQIEASRKNAQLSTGPITPEGKAKSGRNSIRHGLLSRVIPIDAPGYRELLVGLYTSLRPQDEVQRMMVDQIAITTMRLRCISAAEQNLLYTRPADWPNNNGNWLCFAENSFRHSPSSIQPQSRIFPISGQPSKPTPPSPAEPGALWA